MNDVSVRIPGPGGRSRLGAVPRVFATALGVIAALCVLSAVSAALGRGFQPVRQFIDDSVFPAPPNVAYGLFLALLAGALARRKRAARTVLGCLLLAQAVLSAMTGLLVVLAPDEFLVDDDGQPLALKGWDLWSLWQSGVIAVVALVVLLAAKQEFYGRTRKAALRKAILVFAGLLGVSILLGGVLVQVFPGSLRSVGDRWSWAVETVIGGAIQLDITRVGDAPGWVALSVSLFGVVSLFAALLWMLRAQRMTSLLTTDDEIAVRRLLAEHGERDSLGYFATRRDKAVVFAPSGEAAITYRVVAGVCLASGDPLGAPDAWQPAIARWLAMCAEYTWSPAVMGAGEEAAEAYVRAGLKAIELGDEAILDVTAYTLAGPDMRPVRQAVTRIERAGYTARVRRHADIPPEQLAAAAALADRWRDTDTERGFSMALGRLNDPTDGQCVLVEALDAAGNVRALLSFVPWGRTGLSLDLMRRDRDADNGLMEFMVSALAAGAPALGVRRVSLNFAVFRAVFEEGARIGAGPILRAWRRLLLFFSRWWQLESLYRSNVKYRPHWEPRFLIHGDRRDLARVGLASAIAEGFLGRGSTAPAHDGDPALLAAVRDAGSAGPAVEDRPVPASEQTRIRLAKLDGLRARGVDPYPVLVPRDTTLAEVAARFPDLEPDTRTGERVAVTGRVMLMRDHGKLCFATLRDWSGDLQVMLAAPDTAEGDLRSWRADVDLGDHVAIRGEVITSRRGELSILAESWTLAAKCLHPLPDKHSGLTDPEARVRQRYLDLVVRPRSRELLRARGAAVQALRATLLGRDYLEVETPMLQPVHGGANARPFVTHINAYDMRLYLRIAPELYLKRLCVGGVERVFELGRTFRNEGVSYKHNPEFTMLEAYEAYADYTVMRARCQQLIKAAACAIHGSETAGELDLSGDWPVVPVHHAISEALGEEITSSTPEARLRQLCDTAGIVHNPQRTRGAVVLELYERLVEEQTAGPVFYTDFPADVSPLTRPHRDDPALAERWDLVIKGTEVATAYSELVDPVEQRRRLVTQSLLAAGGDPEAMEVDEDFLTALEYAMPPSGGLGLGVDRLVMLLTGTTIRDTLAFPLVRPE
ncbi:bifunctional lysylphosphatidylglycerol synthetase/lysine--tRNA ligase LysX [Amycolatopsis mongoliensis]|uniref:Lysine--tRNA ligase n=1 Tax=Amycolatopsis mongoliensis TaxID=715475 RepID=A0A9Y2NRC0_9PSEU|nr:bifunctional lysylphosphatidylglycerol synthetase/lysine--tRNA ligase LysX [Amycolatopsis sp. 4-36]WIY07605.1 bifunctional lysylphosphatidylglycerol synthetase/lysine--tRNA ligase LysX [Amycolatopsis sp. 4-36]